MECDTVFRRLPTIAISDFNTVYIANYMILEMGKITRTIHINFVSKQPDLQKDLEFTGFSMTLPNYGKTTDL